VFGPGGAGAQLEGSKTWMKDLLRDAGVPTARYGAFTDPDEAVAFLRTLPGPWVVKTDGLAAGKGVLVAESFEQAAADVRAKLSGESFGAAGRRVVIEEGLTGPELSLLAICDGQRAVALAPAQDSKRAYDGDEGPNTGGMGAYSPVPVAGQAVVDEVMDRFVAPTIRELTRRGIDYRGVLYAGIMLTPEGPKLLEYNVRFGDPETQVVVPRLSTDLVDLLGEAASGHIRSEPANAPDAAVTVIMASEGYPEQPRTGHVITGIRDAEESGATVYCAGVGRDAEGRLVTAGGRVLNVTGSGQTIAEARDRAYAAVKMISWPGEHHRSDIAHEVA
jgi:phosphoribosylamine--glycine ligase